MMHLSRRACLSGGAAIAASDLLPAHGQSRAESRAQTLRYVTAGVVNSLDPVMLGATPESTALSTATYDRLLRFGRVSRGDGSYVFDFGKIEGELAEHYELSRDGLEIVLRLRPQATWHDASPVTADDVKWSLDRAVSAETMSKAQVATGSLLSPDQFAVLDPQTVRIRLARADRLAVPNLATAYAPMFNSALARRHATEADPWATGWLKDHTAAGGAYTVTDRVAGERVVLARNDTWINGAKPGFSRLILQTVPQAQTRASLVERGDADLTLGLQPEDVDRLAKSSAVHVISTPMPTGFGALIFNTRLPPFDNRRVRQALSLAIPYEAVFDTALSGRGARLFGAAWTGEPPHADFPQKLPLHTDFGLARQKLAEAGFPNGFETTLSFGVIRAGFAEPAAALIQEAFAEIGVKVRIEKLMDPQMAEAITDKRLPMLLEQSFALFPSTEYFFRIFLSGASRWNFASWNDPAVAEILSRARYEPDEAIYDALAKRLIGLMADEVPMAMLWKPAYDVVTARGITGFTTRYNYYPDLRDLTRA